MHASCRRLTGCPRPHESQRQVQRTTQHSKQLHVDSDGLPACLPPRRVLVLVLVLVPVPPVRARQDQPCHSLTCTPAPTMPLAVLHLQPCHCAPCVAPIIQGNVMQTLQMRCQCIALTIIIVWLRLRLLLLLVPPSPGTGQTSGISRTPHPIDQITCSSARLNFRPRLSCPFPILATVAARRPRQLFVLPATSKWKLKSANKYGISYNRLSSCGCRSFL